MSVIGAASIQAGAVGIAAQSKAATKHAPVEMLRDENGDPLHVIDRQLVSSNWSGYILPKFLTRKNYTTAQATWTVPEVFFDGIESASASWIGIGGFCKSKKCKQGDVDKSLIQLGTEQDAISDGETNYYAWYEMLPQAEIPTTLVVNPGDRITASLSCAGKCKKKQSWTLSIMNETTGNSWSNVVTYESSKLSVEVIQEAPSDQQGVLPLADFSTVTFSDTTANADGVNFSKGDSLVLEDPDGGASSNVSVPDSTMDGFNACFSADSTLAACTSP
jgi:FlaG/FlaF family flagellin (archaellin)